MSIIDSGVRLRANDETYSLAGNRDLTDKKVIVYNDGNMGLETVDTDHVLALDAHVKLDGTEKAFRAYVGESLGYGYWQGGNFGYLHKWDITGNKPLLYQYPFSGAGIDLDFPVVGSICGSRVGDWWLEVGGWFEIVTPTWTDPSWDWVSSAYTLYTDKTKCNGVVYVYRIGATYYLRIWTLTDGVWGYVTHSGWEGIGDLGDTISFEGGGMWEWDGDIYYVSVVSFVKQSYCRNGLLIKDESTQNWGNGKILVSNNFTYLLDNNTAFIYSKTDKVGTFSLDTNYIHLIDVDKCIIPRWNPSYPGTKWKYQYAIGSTLSSIIELPSGGDDSGNFDGGEDGKALQVYGSSGGYEIAGFDPVAGTWTDYGSPWE